MKLWNAIKNEVKKSLEMYRKFFYIRIVKLKS